MRRWRVCRNATRCTTTQALSRTLTAVMSSAAGVARAATSSAATSATMPSAKPASDETSAARSSQTFSMQVVVDVHFRLKCVDLII